MATLNKKGTSLSKYIWLKLLFSEIYISGVPKKACQGCHISEGARGIILNLVSFNALGSKSNKTWVKSVANSFQELFQSRYFVSDD